MVQLDEFWRLLESDLAANLIAGAELLVIVVGFILTISSIKQAKDSRNIDFVINAEGQIDPLFLSLAEQDPNTIRNVFPQLIPDSMDDKDIKPFVLTYFAYRHASRMYYLFANDDISLGMNTRDRKRMADEWMSELAKYNIRIIAEIHQFSHKSDEFNSGFVKFVDELLEKSAKRQSEISGNE